MMPSPAVQPLPGWEFLEAQFSEKCAAFLGLGAIGQGLRLQRLASFKPCGSIALCKAGHNDEGWGWQSSWMCCECCKVLGNCTVCN